MNLAALIDNYAAARIGLRPGTIEQLRVTVRLMERYAGRPLTVSDLSPELAAGFLAAGIKHGRSPSTVNSKRRALLTLWRFAHRSGLAPQRPPDAEAVPRLREPKRVPVAWSVAEIERLITTARFLPGRVGTVPRRYWWPALFLTLYDTASRVGAMLCALTADCDLRERRLLVRAELTKTWADSLYSIHDQTVAAIAAIYDPSRELLFLWPYCRHHLFSTCRRIVQVAGLNADTRGHDLFHKIRRTNLSYCAASSMGLAQQQAGHADPRTTVRHYIDPRISRGQSAVDVLPRPILD